MNLTLVATFGPPLLIVSYILYSDKCPEPTDLCIKTFLLGCLLCIPAGWLNTYFIPSRDFSYLAGFTEEPLKFAALYLYIRTKAHFDEPMDAIVYGTLISLGFATLENYEYVYQWAYDPQAVALLRAFSAIPLHACCGIVMGYYFGMYIFKNKDQLNLVKALFIPVAFHATYNFFAVTNILLMFVVLLILIIFANKLHKELKNEQVSNEC
jgi:RsiW-degrading membrane proteinase PrsW (M82 family)